MFHYSDYDIFETIKISVEGTLGYGEATLLVDTINGLYDGADNFELWYYDDDGIEIGGTLFGISEYDNGEVVGYSFPVTLDDIEDVMYGYNYEIKRFGLEAA